jgi:signal transduction histidine kinase
MAIGLDIACVLLTAILAFLSIREMRRQARLVEERALELELFAARVAHDIRSPLSPIFLAVQRALAKGGPDDPLRPMFLRARNSFERINVLIDDLLAFARAGGQIDREARASVRQAVTAVLEDAQPAAEAARVELRCDIPTEDPIVGCAAGALSSILSNLVGNAIKYIGRAEVRRVLVRCVPYRDRVRITVEDTGDCMLQGSEERIFEPYVRVDSSGKQGLGLGLATAKRLVEAYGGTIGVRTSPAGCTFWFELPRTSTPVPS